LQEERVDHRQGADVEPVPTGRDQLEPCVGHRGDDAFGQRDRDRGIGFAFLAADRGDIIESKQALGRESDLVALPELHRLHARLR